MVTLSNNCLMREREVMMRERGEEEEEERELSIDWVDWVAFLSFPHTFLYIYVLCKSIVRPLWRMSDGKSCFGLLQLVKVQGGRRGEIVFSVKTHS